MGLGLQASLVDGGFGSAFHGLVDSMSCQRHQACPLRTDLQLVGVDLQTGRVATCTYYLYFGRRGFCSHGARVAHVDDGKACRLQGVDCCRCSAVGTELCLTRTN